MKVNIQIFYTVLRHMKQLKGEGLFRGKYSVLEKQGRIILETELRQSEIVFGETAIQIGHSHKNCFFTVKGAENKIFSLSQFANNVYEFTKEAVSFARQKKDYERSVP